MKMDAACASVSNPPKWWPFPSAGDVVWCRFPQADGKVPIKSRPGLIVQVRVSGPEMKEHSDEEKPPGPQRASPCKPLTPLACRVMVAYGSSQRLDTVYPWELVVKRGKDSGLMFDTKFNLARSIVIPYTDSWFTRAPGRHRLQTPKMGEINTLHQRQVVDIYRYLINTGVDITKDFPEVTSELAMDQSGVGQEWDYRCRTRTQSV